MRYDLLTMLPERAFLKIGGRMTLEGGGGGGGGGKGLGKGGGNPISTAAQQVVAQAPQAPQAMPEPPKMPQMQSEKAPDIVANQIQARKARASGMIANAPRSNNSTLLTGPTGVDKGAMSLGRNVLGGGNTLLGG